MSNAESNANSSSKKRRKVNLQQLYSIPHKYFVGLQKDCIASQANGAVHGGALAIGSNSLLKAIQVTDVDDEPIKREWAKWTQDINIHFSAPYSNSENKKVGDCNTCQYIFLYII